MTQSVCCNSTKYKTLLHMILFLICVVFFANVASAQTQKPAPDMSKWMEAVRQQKEAKPSGTKSRNGGATTTKYAPRGNGLYTTNKTTLDRAYAALNSDERKQVQGLPAVPEAFRNDEEAKLFMEKTKGFDLKKIIMDKQHPPSMQLVGYVVSYQSVMQKAQQIVLGGVQLKKTFMAKNPSADYGTNVGKTYVSENALVYLPLGDASFADASQIVVSSNISLNAKIEDCIGGPDYIEGARIEEIRGVYSLGIGGSIIVSFTNNALVDVAGPDLYIFESGAIEPTMVEISTDGVQWLKVGEVQGGVASVDIANVAKPQQSYFYVRLTDLKTSSSVPGADIDAVATIGSAMRMSLDAEVLFEFGKAELKADGIVAVKNLAKQLSALKLAHINIVGYTDDVGNEESNIALSKKRAQEVLSILKLELGANTDFVLTAIGKGESEPVAPNNSEANRRRNRRVEIVAAP
jgi:outer membrane protein OmpA-like peptidoglycan-associated protein